MNNITFWNLIETTKAESNSDSSKQIELLTHRLAQLPPEEIRSFDRLFDHFSRKAYTMHLWNCVASIVGFCSDDGFDYFTAWLIAQGRQVYCTVTRHPEMVGEFITKDSEWALELIMYAANTAYEQVTGIELFDLV